MRTSIVCLFVFGIQFVSLSSCILDLYYRSNSFFSSCCLSIRLCWRRWNSVMFLFWCSQIQKAKEIIIIIKKFWLSRNKQHVRRPESIPVRKWNCFALLLCAHIEFGIRKFVMNATRCFDFCINHTPLRNYQMKCGQFHRFEFLVLYIRKPNELFQTRVPLKCQTWKHCELSKHIVFALWYWKKHTFSFGKPINWRSFLCYSVGLK